MCQLLGVLGDLHWSWGLRAAGSWGPTSQKGVTSIGLSSPGICLKSQTEPVSEHCSDSLGFKTCGIQCLGLKACGIQHLMPWLSPCRRSISSLCYRISVYGASLQHRMQGDLGSRHCGSICSSLANPLQNRDARNVWTIAWMFAKQPEIPSLLMNTLSSVYLCAQLFGLSAHTRFWSLWHKLLRDPQMKGATINESEVLLPLPPPPTWAMHTDYGI